MKSFFIILFKYYDTTQSRWALYVTTSFLIAFYDGIQKYGTIDTIPVSNLFSILLFSTIQALVTWRAFIDQSLGREKAADVSNLKITEPENLPKV